MRVSEVFHDFRFNPTMREQHGEYATLVAAALDFVDKVDVGKARSVDSYAKFRRALSILDVQTFKQLSEGAPSGEDE